MMQTTDTPGGRQNIVVIGNGMVGQRFCEQLIERDTDRRFRLVTFCEEPRAAEIDRGARMVRSDKGVEVTYDTVVMATGSFPFVPPVPGIKKTRWVRLPRHRG